MSGFDVKETMDQIHISEKMQEEIIMNIQSRMESGSRRTWNAKRMAATAAAFVLAAGVVSFPVRAVVSSVVKARMESVPKEEMSGLNDMVQSQRVAADGFSREYTDSEKERNKALWQAYKEGTFPENVIAQVDSEEEVPEGKLCYIRSTGVFNLPVEEMTDEEMLQIIDFQHKMSYAVSHGPQVQEARAESQEKEARLKKIWQDADGISEDEAIQIAEKQLESDFGEKADGLELRTYGDGSHTTLTDDADFLEALGIESKAGMIYDVGFENPETHEIYSYLIDAVDGSILYTFN